MVKTVISGHAKIIRDCVNSAMEIFGRTLTLRTGTRTLDAFGQLSAITSSDTTFTGDLQFGLDLDQRFISTGVVEVGEAVLYLSATALTTLPIPQDQIVDGDSVWEILDQIEAPELGGDSTFYTFRCRRRISGTDN